VIDPAVEEISSQHESIMLELRTIDEAVLVGDRNLLGIKSNYYFRNLHDDPRYRMILKRSSLPAGV